MTERLRSLILPASLAVVVFALITVLALTPFGNVRGTLYSNFWKSSAETPMPFKILLMTFGWSVFPA